MDINIKPGKIRKPFIRLIFSRLALIMIMFGLQLAVLVIAFNRMGSYSKIFMEACTLMSVIIIICIINSRSSSSYKISWAIIVAAFPVLGTLFYLYSHLNAGSNIAFERVRESIKRTEAYSRTTVPVKDRIKAQDHDFAKLADYMESAGGYPAFDNTSVKYYPLGDDVIEDMCAELEKAEKFIFMEYFIVENGVFWDRILDILKKKALDGVEVRFMYDDMGCVMTLPRKYPELLNEAGISTMVFAKIRPFFSTYYNNRDHRKITVIDGRTAFSGGINLADEYINQVERFGHWKDNAFMLKGDAVRSYTMMFLQMWNACAAKPESREQMKVYLEADSGRVPDVENDGFVIPYADGPHQQDNVAQNVYIDVINNAIRHVAVMTPYFIPDNDLLHAVKHAAKSGVEVTLILPHIPDKKIVNMLTKSYYHELLRSGIKIYEYEPGFVHSKLMVADHEIAVMGTVNMDYRSLYLHYECGSIVYKNEAVLQAEEDVSRTLELCCEITAESAEKRNIFFWTAAGVLRVFAPLL